MGSCAAIGQGADNRTADAARVDTDVLIVALVFDRLEGLIDVCFLDRRKRDILPVDVLATGQDRNIIAFAVLDMGCLGRIAQHAGRNRLGRRDVADQHAAADAGQQESHDDQADQAQFNDSAKRHTKGAGDAHHTASMGWLAANPPE